MQPTDIKQHRDQGMVAVIKIFMKVNFLLILLFFIGSKCFAQTNEDLSKIINKTLDKTLIMIDHPEKRATNCFLLKMVVDSQSVITSIGISDSVDSSYKIKFIDNFNSADIQQYFKTKNISSRIILTPVYYYVSNDPKIFESKLLKFNAFNGQMLKGKVQMTKTYQLNVKFEN
jgi:hypothetical protein